MIYKVRKMFAFQASAWEGMQSDTSPDGEARRRGYRRKYAKEINDYEAAKKAGRSTTGGSRSTSGGRSTGGNTSDWYEDFQKRWEKTWEDVNKKWENEEKAKWASDDAAWKKTMKKKASEAESRAAKNKAVASRNKKIKMAAAGAAAAGIVGNAAHRMYKSRQAAFSRKDKESAGEILSDAGIQAGTALGAAGVGKALYNKGKAEINRENRWKVIEELEKDHNVWADQTDKVKEYGRKYRTKPFDTNPNASKRVAAAEKEFEERVWKPWMKAEKKSKQGLKMAAAGAGLLVGSAIAKDHFRDSRKRKQKKS